MGTARQDFERFVRWLNEPERLAPESARRMANLTLGTSTLSPLWPSSTTTVRNSWHVWLANLSRPRARTFRSSPTRPPKGSGHSFGCAP